MKNYTWEEAVRNFRMQGQKFPDAEINLKVATGQIKSDSIGETHKLGKKQDIIHSLQRYEYATKFCGFDATYVYNVCKDCNGEVRNKSATLLNNVNSEAVVRYYVRHGKPIGESSD